MLPHLYVGSYKGVNGNLFLKGKWVVDLAKSVELFVMVSISDMPTIKYWQILETNMVCAKDEIHK